MKSGVIPAAWVVGLVLILAGCTQPNQLATNSPEVTPSAATTPSTAPTPADSPTPSTPPPPASPSPARLIIRTLPFHLGEVGVSYGAVTVIGAGGVKPYKWSISSGALPPGLTLSSTGKATGTPTTSGNFSFVVRLDDSAGGAAGAPSSVLVFRQLKFSVTTATCGNSPSDCSPSRSGALQINYTGGTPGAKPTIKITGIAKGAIAKPGPTGGCGASSPTTNPPPGMTVSASGGVMTIAAGPPDLKTWCYYTAYITFVLINPSPCGAGLLCTSSNKLTVYFNL